MSDSIFEIRDYHHDPDQWADYKAWAHEAAQILHDRLDVLGYWLDADIPTRILGSDPFELPHGHANVTWIVRWDSMEQRESRWEELWEDDEWKACADRHPGFDGYLNMSVRFLKEA